MLAIVEEVVRSHDGLGQGRDDQSCVQELTWQLRCRMNWEWKYYGKGDQFGCNCNCLGGM